MNKYYKTWERLEDDFRTKFPEIPPWEVSVCPLECMFEVRKKSMIIVFVLLLDEDALGFLLDSANH